MEAVAHTVVAAIGARGERGGPGPAFGPGAHLMEGAVRLPPLPRTVPPPSRTNRTRRVPHPVLIGHAASLAPY